MSDKNRKKTSGGGGALGDRWLAIIVVVAVSAVSFALGYMVGGAAGREGLIPAQSAKIEPLPIQEPIPAEPQQKAATPIEQPRAEAPAPAPTSGFDAMPPAEPPAQERSNTPPMKPKSAAVHPAEKPAAQATAAQAPAKPSAPKQAASAPAQKSGTLYTVQVGAFKAQPEADALKKKLSAKGYSATVVKTASKADSAPFKVRLGVFKDRKDADAMYSKVSKQMALKGFVAKVD